MLLRSTGCLAACVLAGCYTSAPEPGVGSTSPGIRRTVVVTTGSDVGFVNALTPVTTGGKLRIAVGGSRGFCFVSGEYAVETLISVPHAQLTTTVPVDVDGDGNFEIMDRGGGWSPVKLASSDGKLLWVFPESDRPNAAANQMTAGDLDGDGVQEFIVGTLGDGLFALRKDGLVLWRREATLVFTVGIVDLEGDGSPEIVHRDGQDLVVRGQAGHELRRFKFGGGLTDMPIWRDASGRCTFVEEADDRTLRIRDASGTLVNELALPDMEGSVDSIQRVRLGDSVVYAVANRRSYNLGGYLYVFSAEGKVLHAEAFVHRFKALASVPDPRHPGNEMLLVGVGNEVIEYRWE